jgi:hypothetical protein
MGDFLRFETMITPILIQIIFWIAVIVSVILGILSIVNGGENSVAIGLAFIILGPIVARIYAEILIVIFRINDHLRHIQHNTERV